MEWNDILRYCLAKPGAYEDHPFGEIPVCCKVNGRIFAQIYPCRGDRKVTLKCTAEFGDFYRTLYPGQVVRGYHCPPVQQPYWNTVYFEDFPRDELQHMMDHAYDTVVKKFSKKVQQELQVQR